MGGRLGLNHSPNCGWHSAWVQQNILEGFNPSPRQLRHCGTIRCWHTRTDANRHHRKQRTHREFCMGRTHQTLGPCMDHSGTPTTEYTARVDNKGSGFGSKGQKVPGLAGVACSRLRCWGQHTRQADPLACDYSLFLQLLRMRHARLLPFPIKVGTHRPAINEDVPSHEQRIPHEGHRVPVLVGVHFPRDKPSGGHGWTRGQGYSRGGTTQTSATTCTPPPPFHCLKRF